MASTTQCDIIRDFAAAWNCGLCASRACKTNGDCLSGQTCSSGACTGRPSGCPAALSTALCAIPDAANKKMLLFEDQYNPMNIFMSAADKAALQQEEKNLLTGIQQDEAGIAAAYPGVPASVASISWPDFNYCLWNPSGSPGGAYNNKYFERNDAQGFGMKPPYPLGGSFAQGSIWKPPKASPVPLTVDYAMNPDLAVIVIFALLVIIFAVLIYSAYKSAKAKPYREEQQKEAERAKLEATDPYRGTAFESYPDPQAKCRAYVESMEAQGYDMSYYRKQCGLPDKPA